MEQGLSESIRLLVAMSEAFSVPHPNTGAREPLLFLQYMGGQNLQHHAFESSDWAGVDEEALDRLASQGLIRTDYGGQSSLKIYVTERGEQVVADAKRILQGDDDPEAEPVDLDWEGVARPVLEATYTTWVQRGAPSNGVLASTVVEGLAQAPGQTYRVMSLLVDGEYLEQVGVLATEHGPAAVTVTAKGLQVVGGWPATSAQAAVGALLNAVDRAIEEEDEPARRTKLERLRTVAMDVGQSTLADVLSRVITGGV